ncbi:MAG: UDP-N-acetylmuramoyl-L-alanyl-D-glutamate--2,6-diaminopimelate ligase, partial [Candidatus Amesbacteria bacterium]|nr:UDP-N-acetylmuramoyl-L-alanyl-D-glutamate--2,6-diaminopimelate ligase [Candidatus Amesbacteria bacterium]
MVSTIIRNIKNLYHLVTGWFYVTYYGFPARKLRIIGVTGTDGKTTTSHLIYETLKAAGKKVALISTVSDTGFHVTNPDARQLQKMIREIVDGGFEFLVLEVTSHGLDQNRLVGIGIEIAVITNITHEHLDYHQNMANYRQAKAKIMKGARVVVLNRDDPSFEWLSRRVDRVTKIVPFTKWPDSRRSLALAGDYNRYNIAAAAAVVKELGVSIQELEVIKNFSGVPGRMEEIKLGQPFRAIVDFAHTPNALEQVLSTLRKGTGKVILVFGCAGLRDHSKRPLMGAIAVKYADKIIITAEDPRTEKLDDIYRDIAAVGSLRVDDRFSAIQKAVTLARKGDIVVI